MFDKKAFIHVCTDGENTKFEYEGNTGTLVILINILMGAVAKDIGMTYKEFAEAVVEDGIKFNEFLKKEAVETVKEGE